MRSDTCNKMAQNTPTNEWKVEQIAKSSRGNTYRCKQVSFNSLKGASKSKIILVHREIQPRRKKRFPWCPTVAKAVRKGLALLSPFFKMATGILGDKGENINVFSYSPVKEWTRHNGSSLISALGSEEKALLKWFRYHLVWVTTQGMDFSVISCIS